jgi:hypothetical protein
MEESIIESSGNVFADLDLEPAEAAILHMRAKKIYPKSLLTTSN